MDNLRVEGHRFAFAKLLVPGRSHLGLLFDLMIELFVELDEHSLQVIVLLLKLFRVSKLCIRRHTLFD